MGNVLEKQGVREKFSKESLQRSTIAATMRILWSARSMAEVGPRFRTKSDGVKQKLRAAASLVAFISLRDNIGD
jgi:hypothetical protein